MKKLFAVLTIALMGMSIGVLAQQRHPGMDMGMKMGECNPNFKCRDIHGKRGGEKPGHQKKSGIGMILRVGDEIGLTDKQRNELERMKVDFAMEKVDRKADVKKAKIRLAAIMRDDDAPESEVLGAIEEVAGLKAELKKMKYLHRKAAKRVLKEEQIEKLKKLRQEKCKFGKEDEVEIEIKKCKMH